MDVRAIDLNLLVVFNAMVEQRSVTKAGEAIALSQPAMSAAVARLRTLFDDPLFVRAGSEMKPTPRALELAVPVHRILDMVRTEVLQKSAFDATTSDRSFTVVTPDIGEINFVPRLVSRLAQEAPNVLLRTVGRPRSAAAEALESGEADIAVGYFPDLHRAGFFQQKLFDNPHVCIVSRTHPGIGARLSLKTYLAASHAVVRPDGREHVFEEYLQQHGIHRKVRLELSHFMSLLPIIEGSDLIATVPQDLAEICSRYGRIRIVDAPIKSPVIAVHQFWHRRFHKDPANAWLRGTLQSLFMSGSRGNPTSPAAG